MKVLVTGGGGFLGSHIVRLLVRAGHDVTSYSRSSYPLLSQLGVTQVKGDLCDDKQLRTAAQGCEAVFHVAAKAGVWGPKSDYIRTNVEGTCQVIKVCQMLKINRLIYTSSPSVVFDGTDQSGIDESAPYPRHFDSAYPETKAQAEQLVIAANSPELATVALRPHLIWGPGDPHLVPRLIERAKQGRLRFIGSGHNLVDSVYVENAAAAHLLAFERLAPHSPISGQVYFITNAEPWTMRDLINGILSAAGIAPLEASLSPRVALTIGATMEGLWRLVPGAPEPPLTRFVVRQLATAHWFRPEKARNELGYVPQITMEEGLKRLAKSLQTESRTTA